MSDEAPRELSARDRPLTPERQRYIEEGRHVVWKVVSMLQGRANLERSELVSLGNEGLVQAAQSFDPAFEIPFEAFAWTRVVGAIRNGMYRERRFHARRQEIYAAALSKAAEVVEAHRDEGDPFSDTPAVDLERARRIADGFVAAAALGYLARQDDPEAQVGRAEETEQAVRKLRNAMSDLPERDQTILQRHYTDDVDLIAVAKEVQVSRATIYRRHHAALMRLADRLRQQGILSAPAPPG